MLELTYYNSKMVTSLNTTRKQVVYYHQQLNVAPSAIKWMKNNYKSLTIAETNVRTTPNTLMFVEGLGEVFVKQKRIDIKKLI